MRLFSIHAYAIDPQKQAEDPEMPTGGAIPKITADLRSLIDQTAAKAEFEKQTAVTFVVDPETRTNEVRDMVLRYAFEAPSTAKAAARDLAFHLSRTMDDRSTRCLFIPAARKSNDEREVTLWTFPRDDAFQLIRGEDGPDIKMLHDIFSQNSRLRKAAFFKGKNIRTDFLEGRVWDSQAGNRSTNVAEFWINKFLQCRFSITRNMGTKLLANTLQKAVTICTNSRGRDQLFAAIIAARNSPISKWSLESFADQFLDGEGYDSFFKALDSLEKNPTTIGSVFALQRDLFEKTLRYRVFSLETGVTVTSPMREVGKSVTLRASKGDTEKILSCTGTVKREKLRQG